MDDNILVIGIAGGTGSGKTTSMNNLISRFEGIGHGHQPRQLL